MSQWQGPDGPDAGSWTTPGPGGPGGGDAPVGPPAAGPAPSADRWGAAPQWAGDPGRAWGHPASAGAPQPGIVPLRPLSLGEIWDGGFRAFRQNPKVMVGLSAVVVGAVSLVQLAASLVTGRDLVGVTNRLESGTGDAADVFGSLQRLVPVLVGSSLLQVVAVLVLNGMLIVAVSRAVLGRTIGLGELWAACRRKVLPLVGLSLIVALAGFVVGALALLPGVLVLVAGAGSDAGGTIALGVGLTLLGLLAWAAGGLWLWVKLSMATPAMLLEGLGIRASLSRSFRLTRRSFWRLLGILLLTSIVVYAVVLAVSAPFSIVGTVVGGVSGVSTGADFGAAYVVSQLLTTVGSILGSLVGYPFLASVTALLYVDLRMRREGLDVELHRAAAGPAQG